MTIEEKLKTVATMPELDTMRMEVVKAMEADGTQETFERIQTAFRKAKSRLNRIPRTLAQELEILRGYFRDTTDIASDWPCLPECDNYGHADGCPHVEPAYAFRKMMERNAELQAKVARLETSTPLELAKLLGQLVELGEQNTRLVEACRDALPFVEGSQMYERELVAEQLKAAIGRK